MKQPMIHYYARIKAIELVNFRNIENGTVEFPNNDPKKLLSGEPSILGIYGQNGSGKSSVIMALGILKSVLSAKPLDKKFLSCIRYGCDRCSLKFTFGIFISSSYTDDDINDSTLFYDAYYDFDIVNDSLKNIEESDSDLLDNTFIDSDSLEPQVLRIENEVFKLRFIDSDGSVLSPKQVVIDTGSKECAKKSIAFGNASKFKFFTGNDPTIAAELGQTKAVVYENSQSFIFSPKVIMLLKKGVDKSAADLDFMSHYFELFQNAKDPTEYTDYIDSLSENDQAAFIDYFVRYTTVDIIKALHNYGRAFLHVIDTYSIGQTTANKNLPLHLWYRLSKTNVRTLRIPLNMDAPSHVPEQYYSEMLIALESLSAVLQCIVPGITLDIKDYGKRLTVNNKEDHIFEILSNRGNAVIPLKYESDGIRRIISILSLLVAAYNEPSITLAIDEMDSGIFEYLLGEILTIMADSVKGQLIFTSHNLRALEVLPAKYLTFSTVDPESRFIKIPNRGNSNLRDSYFRHIVLGDIKNNIYNHTDKYSIEVAMYQAGHQGDNNE